MKPKTDLNSQAFGVNTGTVIGIVPIVPEKAEAWRRLLQEVADSRRREHEASRRRLGIRAEWVWISETHQWTIGMLAIETDAIQPVLAAFISSTHPFDCWFRNQFLILHGVDLTGPSPVFLPELVFSWRDNQ